MVELIAVLAVMALITGVAAVSLRGVKTHTDVQFLTDKFVALDTATRQRAVRDGQAWRIVIDMQNQRAWAERHQANSSLTDVDHSGFGAPTIVDQTSSAAPVTWRDAIAVARVVRLPDQSIEEGQAVIVIDREGRSPDYAVQVSLASSQSSPSSGSPGADVRHDYTLLIAGETGQAQTELTSEDLDAVAETLADARAHPH